MSQHYANAKRLLDESIDDGSLDGDTIAIMQIEVGLYIGEQLELLAGVFGVAQLQAEGVTSALPKELRDELLGRTTPVLTGEQAKAIGWAASICERLATSHDMWGGVPVGACASILSTIPVGRGVEES